MSKIYKIEIAETLIHEVNLYGESLTDNQVKLLEKAQHRWPLMTDDDKKNIVHLLDQKVDVWRDWPLDSDIGDIQVAEADDE